MSDQDLDILIIDEVHPILLKTLDQYRLSYQPEIKAEDVEKIIGDFQGLIVRSKLSINAALLDKAANLKFIGRLGSGLDNIDEKMASSLGIILFNAPEGNCAAVAEQTIGMMISLLAKIHSSAIEVKSGRWDRKRNSGIELNSLTVGIIGYGHVGSYLAKLLLPFGCKILVYDKYKSDFGTKDIKESSLANLQENSDIVTLHIPLSKDNYHFVNWNFINDMKNKFYLLNLSRGEIINTNDMIEGIKRGKILGCALDVLENEQIDALNTNELANFSYLKNHTAVLITPHIGGLTQNSFYKLGKILGEKIKDWLELQPLVNSNE